MHAHFTSTNDGAGVDQNVSLRGHLAFEGQGSGGVDDNTGVGTPGNEIALQCGGTHRVQDHAAIERFDQAGGQEGHRLGTRTTGASIHINSTVATNGAGYRDGTGRRTGLTKVNHGAASAGINGVTARRRGGACSGSCGLDLGEAQAFCSAVGDRCNAQFVVAGEQQAAIIQTHRYLAVSRIGKAKGGVDGRLHVSHDGTQTTQTCARTGGAQRDVFGHVYSALLKRQVEGGCGTEVAVGKLDKAVGSELLRPGRCQY